MATSTIPESAVASEEVNLPKSKVRKRRRSKWLTWKRYVLLIAPALFVAFLPQIIAHPSVLPLLLQHGLGDASQRVDVDAVSLGWFQPASLHGFQLKSADGERTLASIESLNTDRPLWQLVTSRDDLGQIQLHGATLLYQGPDSDLYWSETLESFSSDGGGKTPHVEIHLEDCTLQVESSLTDNLVSIESIEGVLSVGATPEEVLAVKIDGEIRDQATGQAKCRVELGYDSESLELTRADVAFDAASIELSELEPLISFGQTSAELSGAFTGRGRFTRRNEELPTSDLVQIDGTVTSLTVQSDRFAEDEMVTADSLSLSCTLELEEDGIQFQHVSVDSSIGDLEVKGYLPTAGASEDSIAENRVPKPFALSGKLDLAKLSGMLPRTVGLRDDVQLVNAVTYVSLDRSLSESGHDYQTAIGMNAIDAIIDRRRIRWDEPFKIDLKLTESDQGWSIGRFVCRSDFAQLSATGDMNTASFDFQCDLDKLHEVVDEFFDWPEFHMAGRVTGRGATRRTESSGRRLLVEAQLSNIRIQTGQGFSFITDDGKCMMLADFDEPIETLEACRVQLEESQDDLVVLELSEPLQLKSDERDVRLNLRATGGVREWTGRVSDRRAADVVQRGRFDIKARGRWDGQHAAVVFDQLNFSNLRLENASCDIQQRDIRGTGSATWSSSSNQIEVPELVLSGESVSADIQDLEWNTETGQGAGDLSLRGRIEDLIQWVGLCDTVRCLGAYSAQLNCRTDPRGMRITSDFRCERLLVDAQTAGEELNDLGAIRCRVVGLLAENGTAVELDEATVTSSWLSLAANGTISDLDRTCRASLTGRLSYDWKPILLLTGLKREQLLITGKRSERFHVNGPLNSLWTQQPESVVNRSALQMESTVGWDQGQIMGMPLGGLESRVVVVGQQATVDPIKIGIGTGQLSTTPLMTWSTGEPVLAIREPLNLNTMELSPELCKSWLKYVAPGMADATRVEGRLGLHMDQLVVPVQRPKVSRARGVLRVDRATMKPGRVLQSVELVIRQVEAVLKGRQPRAVNADRDWIRLPGQDVEFVMRDGRVYHRRMILESGDLRIETSGSVGLDDSLNMTVEIPVREEWVRGNRYLSRMAGKKLQIPVTGSLSRPVPDSRAIQSLIQQAGQGAVESVIEDEVDKQLGRLLNGLGGQR